MIKSMTGFGAYSFKSQHKTFTVEIKSINAKQFDLALNCLLNVGTKKTNPQID